MVEWRIIQSAPDYEVSSHGQVRRMTAHKLASRWPIGREVKAFFNHAGYRIAVVMVASKRCDRRIARLVAEAFIGPCMVGYEVNHKDGNKQNDCVDNLEYVTRSGNMLHAFATGLTSCAKGEKSCCAKLTNAQAEEIRSGFQLRGRAYDRNVVALKYGVSLTTIGKIVRGEAYATA